MRNAVGAALFLASLAGLVGCASADTGGEAAATLPLMSQPTAPGYPDLRSVPQSHIANTDQRHWAEVQRDVLAGVSDLRDNPRAVYGAPPEDPAAFVEDARQDLMDTRDSH